MFTMMMLRDPKETGFFFVRNVLFFYSVHCDWMVKYALKMSTTKQSWILSKVMSTTITSIQAVPDEAFKGHVICTYQCALM